MTVSTNEHVLFSVPLIVKAKQKTKNKNKKNIILLHWTKSQQKSDSGLQCERVQLTFIPISNDSAVWVFTGSNSDKK